jgi:hypothetical protein
MKTAEVKEKLSNGNTIIYQQLENGTCYHAETPEEVVKILEHARQTRQRIRLFYGDRETGKDWNEEHDTAGTIGRSTGTVKIPLLINNTRSTGGPGLLDHCIIKITAEGRTLYQHPNYHTGTWTTGAPPNRIGKTDMKKAGYTAGVYKDGENHANFKTQAQADRFMKFITGQSNRK